MLSDILGLSDPSVGSVLLLILFFMSIGWFADTFFKFLLGLFGVGKAPALLEVLLGMLPFPALLFFMWWGWRAAQKRRVQMRASQKEMCMPHAGVIAFLSPARDHYLEVLAKGEEPEPEDRGFSWWQVVRGLEPHSARLRYLWVVTSKESVGQMAVFRQWVTDRFPELRVIMADENPVNIEDVGAVVDVLESIYSGLPDGCDASDVVLDVTGGFKTCSIAGMIVAMASRTRAVQYVQNHAPYRVLSYDWTITILGRKVREQTL